MSYEPIVLFEEQFVDTRQAKPSIDMEERGLQFGDGVYEVIRLYEGTFHLLGPHLARLYRSMEEIELIPHFSKALLVKWLYELVEHNEFTGNGNVYLQVTRGVQSRSHAYAANTKPTLYAYLTKKERPTDEMLRGIHACTEQDIRWLRCDIKSLNLLPNVMAKTNAERKNCQEALLVRSGIVTEGSSSNCFIVKNGTLYTHPANHLILNGIVRQYILSLAVKLGISVREEVFSVRDVLQADECFITGTTSEITPVTHLDGTAISHGIVGRVTRQLQTSFQESLPGDRIAFQL
ncbi:D-amino-acid transaminase [Ectobacillus funiculus]|uniref:D-alanine aminotransferase n=1 Tax=Ectobacillus funiculus TaxID=137993 RepID=A0ABV5WDQ5_9BACI